MKFSVPYRKQLHIEWILPRALSTVQYCGIRCYSHIIDTSKEPVCPRVELILKIIIILLIIFLGFIKSKPC